VGVGADARVGVKHALLILEHDTREVLEVDLKAVRMLSKMKNRKQMRAESSEKKGGETETYRCVK
jgi:hypothetical protein